MGYGVRVQQSTSSIAPTWSAVESVSVNELRVFNGVLYRSLSARTTGALFDATEELEWEALGADTSPAQRLTVDTTLDESHGYVFSGGASIITLPTAVGISGKTYHITNENVAGITIETTGAETINGQANKAMPTQSQSFGFTSDGTNWIIT